MTCGSQKVSNGSQMTSDLQTASRYHLKSIHLAKRFELMEVQLYLKAIDSCPLNNLSRVAGEQLRSDSFFSL
jgi:hypothetical protein